MPRIYVEFVGMKQIANTTQSVSSKFGDLRSDFLQTVQGLDWEVKFQSNINSSANQIAQKLRLYEEILKKYHAFLNDAYASYEKLNSEESEIELVSLADAQDKTTKTFDDDKSMEHMGQIKEIWLITKREFGSLGSGGSRTKIYTHVSDYIVNIRTILKPKSRILWSESIPRDAAILQW